MNSFSNKHKIFNDPIYGFVSLPYEIIFDLIEHPYFQRLRRIKQLGLTNLVYPGALHTRFHHAMGAMHLMGQAIEEIRSKGHEITDEEAKAVNIAILLHDIGHGPFSHALEHSLVNNVTHEDISQLFMNRLNKEFNGELTLAIKIFQNKYHKKFIIARRLMYWQVYLHKTVLSAENLLVNILKRAKELAKKNIDLFCTPAL